MIITALTTATIKAASGVLSASTSTTVAADDITGTLNNLIADVQVTATSAAVLLAVVFILYKAFKSGFSTAGIISAILIAGVMVWGVWNVTAVRDSVDKQINGAGVVHLEAPLSQPSDGLIPLVL